VPSWRTVVGVAIARDRIDDAIEVQSRAAEGDDQVPITPLLDA